MACSIGKGRDTVFKRVYVEITNMCNLSCSFCPGTQRPHRSMSTDEFAALTRRLQGHTRYLYLHVLGEPLLHPHLGEILEIAHTGGFRVCITTNGTLLPRQLSVLHSAPALHKLSVSLHSFEGNVSAGNLEDYVRSCAHACRQLSQAGVICALRLWNEGGLAERNGEILAILGQELGLDIAALAPDNKGNLRLGDHLYLENAAKFDWPDMQAPAGGVEFCHGLRQQIAVLCDGTVVPCCLDGEGQIPLGNLFTDTLPHIVASPRAQAILDGFSRRRPSEELCRRCGYARRFSKGVGGIL